MSDVTEALDHRINMGAVPSVGRWMDDNAKLRDFARQVPAFSWQLEKLETEEERIQFLEANPAYQMTVMPDAVPGLYGNLEGYAVEVPGEVAVEELMFGVNGPGLVSTWILKDARADLLDGLLGAADATVRGLIGTGASFWDLSTAKNPFERMATRFAEDDDVHQAVVDISYGLSDNARILLVKWHKHPRDEYRLLIQGGSSLAEAYLRGQLADKNHGTVKQATDVMDVALNIVRRHHAILAHAFLEEMTTNAPEGIIEELTESLHDLLTASRVNQSIRANHTDAYGVRYAISDTEQAYNCLHHMWDAETGVMRFIFYNHCICLHLSRGGIFLNSGPFYVALMQANRDKNASTLTTTKSEIPKGRASFLWAFPLATPFSRLLTADDYADWGENEEDEENGRVRNGKKIAGFESMPREDFIVNTTLEQTVLRMLHNHEAVDELRFLAASPAYVSSADGYCKPMSRIIYDLATSEQDAETGYPKNLPHTNFLFVSTHRLFSMHMLAQKEFAKASLTNGLDGLPHGTPVHGHEISTILRDGRIMMPYATLVWLYYKKYAGAIRDYYEGRGALPAVFRKELDAQRTTHIIRIPVKEYIA